MIADAGFGTERMTAFASQALDIGLGVCVGTAATQTNPYVGGTYAGDTSAGVSTGVAGGEAGPTVRLPTQASDIATFFGIVKYEERQEPQLNVTPDRYMIGQAIPVVTKGRIWVQVDTTTGAALAARGAVSSATAPRSRAVSGRTQARAARTIKPFRSRARCASCRARRAEWPKSNSITSRLPTQRPERPDQPEQRERPDQPEERPERPERPDQAEPQEQRERPEQQEQQEHEQPQTRQRGAHVARAGFRADAPRGDAWRFDAGETAAFYRQLQFIETQIYETKYPQNRARTYIPVAANVPAGYEFFVWRIWDFAGQAKSSRTPLTTCRWRT